MKSNLLFIVVKKKYFKFLSIFIHNIRPLRLDCFFFSIMFHISFLFIYIVMSIFILIILDFLFILIINLFYLITFVLVIDLIDFVDLMKFRFIVFFM
jgi:hypothetical protein